MISSIAHSRLSPTLLLGALAVLVAITFQILLPVVPVMVERAGPHGAAGAATAALFLGAVTGELTTPWLLGRWSSKRVLISAQLITAVASLVYFIPHAPWWAMLGAAYGRGVGMGVTIVVSVALISELAAPERRGAAIGFVGLALSGPGIFVPSIGVYLLANGRANIAEAIAFAAAALGALVAVRIPERPVHAAEPATNLIGALRRPGMLVIMAGYVLCSCSFGGVVTYAPVALPLEGLGSAASFLLISGATRAAARWVAGVLGDRRPSRLVLAVGMALTLAGLVVLALSTSTLAVLIAAVAYGAGYGAAQTAAFLVMSERGTRQDSGAISALWNGGIDLGSSLGGSLIGLTASHYGYGAAAWVLPVAVAIALPLTVWPAPPAVAKQAEYRI